GLVAHIGPHIGVMSPSPQTSITDVREVRVIAFSAAPEVRVADSPALQPTLPNERMSPLFIATIGATEEAIINSLFAAETMGQRPYRRGSAALATYLSHPTGTRRSPRLAHAAYPISARTRRTNASCRRWVTGPLLETENSVSSSRIMRPMPKICVVVPVRKASSTVLSSARQTASSCTGIPSVLQSSSTNARVMPGSIYGPKGCVYTTPFLIKNTFV